MPTLPAIITMNLLSSFGHWARDDLTRNVNHAVIDVLLADRPNAPMRKQHTPWNLQRQLLLLTDLDNFGDLLDVAVDKRKWIALSKRIALRTQVEFYKDRKSVV